jgi:hypothetical protein
MSKAKSKEYYTRNSMLRYYREHAAPSIRRILGDIRTWAVLDLGGGPEDAVFLAGGMRSGSGWVANLINYDNTYRYMYEPFTPEFCAACKPFSRTLYIAPDNRESRYVDPAKAILGGRIRKNLETHIFNRRIVANKRLIKEVRANLWLKWLRVNFPGTPIVLLMRHPCATVNSRLKRPEEQRQLLYDEFVREEGPLRDYLRPYWDEITGAGRLTEFERGIFSWCIQHFVPLTQCVEGELHVAFYENLATEPQSEIARLFAYLGKRFDDRIFEALKRPSEVTSDYSAILTGDSVSDSWREQITTEQLRQALKILQVFGLDAVYSEDSKPSREGLEAFVRGRSGVPAGTPVPRA